MIRSVRIFLVILLAILLQVAILPAYLRDPFKPNMLLVLVCFLALRQSPSWAGGVIVYMLGLVQDAFSGIYFGLNGFTYLFIYVGLRKVADQLYTDRGHLMVIVVFLATFVAGCIHLLLLLLFSSVSDIYASILPDLFPQALVNALVASIVFGLLPLGALEEAE